MTNMQNTGKLMKGLGAIIFMGAGVVGGSSIEAGIETITDNINYGEDISFGSYHNNLNNQGFGYSETLSQIGGAAVGTYLYGSAREKWGEIKRDFTIVDRK